MRGFKTQEDIHTGLVPGFAEELRQTRLHNAADQLVQAGPISYTYDDDGNLTEAGAVSYAYDFDNRLIQVTSGDTVTEYHYDALGTRVGRTVTEGSDPAVATWFVVDYRASLKMPLAEADADGRITRYYVWSSHGLLAHLDVTDDGQTLTIDAVRYYHADELGSTLALTDETGAVTDRFAYSPYGQPLGRTSTTDTPSAKSRAAGHMRLRRSCGGTRRPGLRRRLVL